MPDYPDYTVQTAVNADVKVETDVQVKPQGGILEIGTISTTSEYQEVASVTVTDGYKFNLSKLVVSATKACFIKFQWNNTDISIARNLADQSILFEHFPMNYKEMIGDGIKKFAVLAIQDTVSGTVSAEIVGEQTVVT